MVRPYILPHRPSVVTESYTSVLMVFSRTPRSLAGMGMMSLGRPLRSKTPRQTRWRTVSRHVHRLMVCQAVGISISPYETTEFSPSTVPSRLRPFSSLGRLTGLLLPRPSRLQVIMTVSGRTSTDSPVLGLRPRFPHRRRRPKNTNRLTGVSCPLKPVGRHICPAFTSLAVALASVALRRSRPSTSLGPSPTFLFLHSVIPLTLSPSYKAMSLTLLSLVVRLPTPLSSS